jgi:hypothetical protein
MDIRMSRPKFEVVDYKWPHDQEEHKGHRKAYVKKGTTVFAIRYNPFGRCYFTYAYLSSGYAELIAERLGSTHTSIEANFKDHPLVVTSRIADNHESA